MSGRDYARFALFSRRLRGSARKKLLRHHRFDTTLEPYALALNLAMGHSASPELRAPSPELNHSAPILFAPPPELNHSGPVLFAPSPILWARVAQDSGGTCPRCATVRNMELVLAPLMGITVPEFRRVYHRHFPWFDRALAPFVSVTHGIVKSQPRFKDVLPEENRHSIPLEPQILGKEGSLFKEVADLLHHRFGYAQVNWNIGCPSSTVTSRERGSGILPHPGKIREFLDQAFQGSSVKISVKTRLGLDSADEWPAVAEVLRDFPLAELTIHPRTGSQQYGGWADRQAFQSAMKGFDCPVIYNGDVNTPEDALQILSSCPDAAGLMLGRGAVIDPWLPGRIRGVPCPAWESREFFAGLKAFHDDLAQEFLHASSGHHRSGRSNEGLLCARMKELWHYWAPHFSPEPNIFSLGALEQGPSRYNADPREDLCGPLARSILKSRSAEEYFEAVDRAFAAMDC